MRLLPRPGTAATPSRRCLMSFKYPTFVKKSLWQGRPELLRLWKMQIFCLQQSNIFMVNELSSQIKKSHFTWLQALSSHSNIFLSSASNFAGMCCVVLSAWKHLILQAHTKRKGSNLIGFSGNCGYCFLILHQNSTNGGFWKLMCHVKYEIWTLNMKNELYESYEMSL